MASKPPIISLIKPNLPSTHPTMIEPLDPYILVKEKLKPPSHLLLIAPAQFSQAIQEVLLTASKSFSQFRRLQRIFADRYFYTCSKRNPKHFRAHTDSIARLSQWKAQYPSTHDPNLLPTAKLPRHAVNLHLDRDTYEKFVAAFEQMKHEFLIGPYLAWCNAKRVLDHLMASAFSLLPRPEELMIQSWWNEFVWEMAPWEEMLEKLRLPSWKTILEDMERVVGVAVDLEGEWERVC
ncbi:conserved hypothetical protein [Histoplasma capsulatum var. duboisii H88]|uniref:Uncharacterized protein n=1 Tax=Ajellomyces capsulatus (strain H88) TaxID=544711 RepID=F0U8T9_AJEC8|nr:conserved hypothetical protein [Histoplasma capsulatum var. duboisii H88]